MSYAQPQYTLPMLAGNWWTLLLRGIAAVLFLGFRVARTPPGKQQG